MREMTIKKNADSPSTQKTTTPSGLGKNSVMERLEPENNTSAAALTTAIDPIPEKMASVCVLYFSRITTDNKPPKNIKAIPIKKMSISVLKFLPLFLFLLNGT